MATKAERIVTPSYSCHPPQDKKDGKSSSDDTPSLTAIFSPFHAGTLLGMRKGKIFLNSLLNFFKSTPTADLISSMSTGFMLIEDSSPEDVSPA
jgi:hypothetical protein